MKKERAVGRNQGLEWLEIAAATSSLGIESATVIGLRLAQAATGSPEVADEAWRMWSEKFVALIELQTRLLAGGPGISPSGAATITLRHYGERSPQIAGG